MTILIDTNVILDVLCDREGFVKDSAAVIGKAAKGAVKAYITINTVTDIYYLAQKHIRDHEAVKAAMLNIFEILDIVEVTKPDCIKAFNSPMPDFDDALLAQCAKRINADYIITRNVKDFAGSAVKALSPAEFISAGFPKK